MTQHQHTTLHLNMDESQLCIYKYSAKFTVCKHYMRYTTCSILLIVLNITFNMTILIDSLLIRNLYYLYILLHFSFTIFIDITHLMNTLYPIFIIHSSPGWNKCIWQCNVQMYRFGRKLIMNAWMPGRGLCSWKM